MKLSRQPAWVYVLPALYLGLCLTIALDLIPSEGSWGWFPAFVAALSCLASSARCGGT